jgi:hypothetical protein
LLAQRTWLDPAAQHPGQHPIPATHAARPHRRARVVPGGSGRLNHDPSRRAVGISAGLRTNVVRTLVCSQGSQGDREWSSSSPWFALMGQPACANRLNPARR